MKTITLNCPDSALESLANAIEVYANAAYPPGGSECSQAARAALLDAVASIHLQRATKTGEIDLSRRLSSNIKAALRYAVQCEPANPVFELLLKTVSGEIVSDEKWLSR